MDGELCIDGAEQIAAACGLDRDVAQRVAAELLGEALHRQQFEVALQQLRLGVGACGVEVAAERRNALVEGLDQRLRRGLRRSRIGVLGSGLILRREVVQAAVQPCQCLTDVGRGAASRFPQRRLRDGRRIHAPPPLDEVVRLVDQHPRTPAILQG